jgi:hypothetical protein
MGMRSFPYAGFLCLQCRPQALSRVFSERMAARGRNRFHRFVSNVVVARLLPVFAAFLVLKAALDAFQGASPLASIVPAIFLLSITGTVQTAAFLEQRYGACKRRHARLRLELSCRNQIARNRRCCLRPTTHPMNKGRRIRQIDFDDPVRGGHSGTSCRRSQRGRGVYPRLPESS